jgi:hypothetical protein
MSRCLHAHAEPCPAPDHRPCGPVAAVIRLQSGNLVQLCKDDLDHWLDTADAGELEEPEALRWVVQ